LKTDTEIVIIGAGVVGLSIAYELSKYYKEIFLIEKNKKFGEETSSRSSEVIHSGIYYPAGTLKAKLCVEGNAMIYDFCDKHEVNYNKCGKLIVANSENQFKQLDKIENQGFKNGLKKIIKLNKREILEKEPNIDALKALYLEETGIIDSCDFMGKLENLSINNGVKIIYDSELIDLNKKEFGYDLLLKENRTNDFSFTSKIVINSAGLYSDKISHMLGIKNPNYKLYYCKGEYFSVGNRKNKMVNRLIYPVPDPNLVGLGVHVTLDIDHGLRLGPNTIYLEDNVIDYSVDKNHLDSFYKSAKVFLPFIQKSDLYPAYSGIRPKLQAKGDPSKDFVIKEENNLGFKNYFNLIGIESPGLTSSLAIAKYVKNLIKK